MLSRNGGEIHPNKLQTKLNQNLRSIKSAVDKILKYAQVQIVHTSQCGTSSYWYGFHYSKSSERPPASVEWVAISTSTFRLRVVQKGATQLLKYMQNQNFKLNKNSHDWSCKCHKGPKYLSLRSKSKFSKPSLSCCQSSQHLNTYICATNALWKYLYFYC